MKLIKLSVAKINLQMFKCSKTFKIFFFDCWYKNVGELTSFEGFKTEVIPKTFLLLMDDLLSLRRRGEAIAPVVKEISRSYELQVFAESTVAFEAYADEVRGHSQSGRPWSAEELMVAIVFHREINFYSNSFFFTEVYVSPLISIPAIIPQPSPSPSSEHKAPGANQLFAYFITFPSIMHHPLHKLCWLHFCQHEVCQHKGDITPPSSK